MKKLVGLLIISASIISCKHDTEKGRFTLKGDIKNITDQKIYLEQLYFSQKNPEVLDTAEIKNGKFDVTSIAKEEGLFRLRLEKSPAVYIFINDNPSVNFSADAKDSSLRGNTFYTRANTILKKLLLSIDDKRNQMTALADKITALKNVPNTDSLSDVTATQLDGLATSFKSFIVSYVDTVSDPVVAMFALGFTRGVDPAQLKTVVPNIAKRFPAHQGVASLVIEFNKQMTDDSQSQQQQAPKIAQVGSIAPDITMNDINGKSFSLSQLRGKYVLVDFWASWCAPCRGENPNVLSAYHTYQNKNFTVLGVSLDSDKAAWQKAVKDDKLEWQQISDLKGWNSAAVPLYGFDGIPYNVLVDPQGKILGTSLRGKELEDKLAEVLK